MPGGTCNLNTNTPLPIHTLVTKIKKEEGATCTLLLINILNQLAFLHFTTYKASTSPSELFNFHPNKSSTHTINVQNKLKNALMSSIFSMHQTTLC